MTQILRINKLTRIIINIIKSYYLVEVSLLFATSQYESIKVRDLLKLESNSGIDE